MLQLMDVMYSKNKKHKKSNKSLYTKIGLAVVIGLIIGGLAYWQFVYKDNQANNNTETSEQTEEDSDGINYSPPTQEEQQSSDDIKDKDTPVSNPSNPSTSSGGNSSNKKSVTPTITSANLGGVSGYVTGVFEEGGTCTATFKKGSTTKTRTSTGFQNASYTQCAPIDIPSGFLSSGTWTLTLKYSSDTAAGTSAAQELKI